MDVERLLKLGNQLELKGDDLRIWVDTHVNKEEKKRTEEKEGRERERQIEIEKQERERQIEIEKQERERQIAKEEDERKEKERQIEIEKQERERQIAKEEDERREREIERKEKEREIEDKRRERERQIEIEKQERERKIEIEKQERERQIEIEKQERERQIAKEEDERKEKERQIEIEKQERERKIEIEKQERERQIAKEEDERKEKERQFDIERSEREAARMEKELAILQLRSEISTPNGQETSTNGRTHPVKSPRLPYFDDASDQIDSYLLRFERYAKLNSWDRKDWAVHLTALLRGQALEVGTRLSEEEATDYDAVKEALLKQYNLTEDGFNEKFRKSRPQDGERLGQFKTRISAYLDKWLELSGKGKDSATDILDLVLKEQLLSVCGRDLLMFLKERKPTTARELVELGDKFIEAHGTVGAFTRTKEKVKEDFSPPVSLNTRGREGRSSLQIVCQICYRTGHSARDCRARREGRSSLSRVCDYCYKPGHQSRDCRARTQVSAMGAVGFCQHCGRRGHHHEDCLEKMRKDSEMPDHQVAAIGKPPESPKCEGHTRLEMKCGCQVPMMSAACTGHEREAPGMPVARGFLNGKKVRVLRDSGSSCVVVRKGLIDRETNPTCTVMVYLADGKGVRAVTVDAVLECPYFSGQISAVEMENPLYDVILGNIPGVKCPGTLISSPWTIQEEDEEPTEVSDLPGKPDTEPNDAVLYNGKSRLTTKEMLAVETRATKHRTTKDLITPPAVETGVTVEELKEEQASDKTLKVARELAGSGDTIIRRTGKHNESWYAYERGVLMRFFRSPKVDHGDVVRQVMVPKGLRKTVMQLAHEGLLAGHLAAKKTTDRILSNFYWPRVWDDVARFCQSCDQCQRSAPKGMTPKVPLSGVPLIGEPFSRVAVDLVGPILPASDKGNRYILTVVDYCTRYPEAVALKSIQTERVAEGLVDIFSRIGIPKEMLSDRGTQFTSDLMKEVCRLLSVKQLSTSPYHPQANGLVERFNATLKNMLKKLAAERPSDWDRYVNAALFAYREAPQESLGFSPFELLYGRPVRGPMTILRELWTKDIQDEEVKTTYQYVVDLREKMDKTIKMAHQNLQYSAARYKAHFDKNAKARTFQAGEKVLLLLPTAHNKLQLKWQGPYEVIKVVGPNNYSISTGKTTKTYHANMLKKYHDRTPSEQETCGILQCAVAAVISEGEDEDEEDREIQDLKMNLPVLHQTETVRDVVMCKDLDHSQQNQLLETLKDFKDVLTDVPGRTDTYTYELKLTSNDPIRKKPYPVPHALKSTLREEVEAMLQAGIVEPSNSPYCSPSVVVKKKDGTNRYCVDFRALNNITVFDAEPMPRLDDLFQEIGTTSNFVTKIDLTKGYWQIPLADESKPKTAFATEHGLMQFTVLPFGLQGAPSAFARMMRTVVGGLPNVKNYIDDILIHTASWDEHVSVIKTVLQRLQKAGLTAKPSKCLVGFPVVEFLGHNIGSGRLSPTLDKIEAIKNAEPPSNKKQMRSFIGLASFYRRYVPNFSAIASPLTDATKKGMPNRINWEEPQKRAFAYIKKALTSAPVLRLPDFNKCFILATDASDTGLGAVLMQEHDGEKFPILYLSRKLCSSEQRYSVVEKECLAVVWAVRTLSVYLIGREFTIETDHAPLLYLNKAKSENGRLMRWALLLHQYRFNIRSVKGSDNHGPDFLSRLA